MGACYWLAAHSDHCMGHIFRSQVESTFTSHARLASIAGIISSGGFRALPIRSTHSRYYSCDHFCSEPNFGALLETMVKNKRPPILAWISQNLFGRASVCRKVAVKKSLGFVVGAYNVVYKQLYRTIPHNTPHGGKLKNGSA